MRLRFPFGALVVLLVGAALAPAARAALPVKAITITVNSTGDAGDINLSDDVCRVALHGTTCTLRAAIQTANHHAETSGRDTIKFAIATGQKTIQPGSELPSITDQVVIDASTQPAASGTDPCSVQLGHPCIELDGTNAAGPPDGLRVNAGPSLIRGFAVNRFSVGIVLADGGQGGDRIEGNYVGTDPTGALAEPNGDFGILVGGGPGDVIGGTTAAQANVVSGNVADGIELAADSVLVEGNFIGTNAAGTAALPNGDGGIETQLHPTGLTIGAPGAPNVISGNDGFGIRVVTDDSVVQGNLIGTDVTGSAAIPNGSGGIDLPGGTNDTIGGTAAGAGNLISGNQSQGVLVETVGPQGTPSGHVIEGNRIGTTLDGTAAIPGQDVGVQLETGTGLRVGGTDSGAGNLISGNGVEGVAIDPAVDGAVVQGNLIGTNAAGTAAIGNGPIGINSAGSHTLVGGTTATARNVVSGNTTGISMFPPNLGNCATSGNLIQGNFIGTDVTGEHAVPNVDGVVLGCGGDLLGGAAPGAGNVISGNTGIGVQVGGVSNRVIGNRIGLTPSGAPLGNHQGLDVFETSRVGGLKAASANRIAFNDGAGVVLRSSVTGMRILRNSIHDNGALGIDLDATGVSGDGVTKNDPGDADTGPNNLQNFPVLLKAVQVSGGTKVSGHLSSTASTKFTIRLFSSVACDPSGFGEGTTFLASTSVTTDGTGAASFAKVASTVLPVGRQVTALATDPQGNTSEFSHCRAVTSA